MKKTKMALIVGAVAFAAFAAPWKVALVVQNHTSDAPTLPMSALADTLTSRLSGDTLRVVNPHNVIGVNQNRTARGETMPEASAQEIGRLLGAAGVVTASIQEFTGEDIGVPAVAHTLKVRLALNLADAATGETVCGVDGVELSKNYTSEKVKSDTATLYEGLMHAAAAKGAEKLLAKISTSGWESGALKLLNVFFGCNVLGADVQIDGQSYGTCPVQIALTPGSHSLLISYPPYYYEFKSPAMFNQDGQTYKVVLQLTPEGYHIELSFPEDGTGYEVGAVALIKNGPADEQENAKKFIDWICSVDGQGSYAENDSFRVPTNTQAPVADGLVTLDQVPVIDYDAVWASNNKSKYCEEFEEKIVAKPES